MAPLFLQMPLEIRLQIYSYIISSHSASHPHLSPCAPSSQAVSSSCPVRVIFPGIATSMGRPELEESPHETTCSPKTSIQIEFPPSRRRCDGQGCGHVPSALLRSCKQVLNEAKILPWQINAFVFINWFGCGIYAARSFLNELLPWQRENMRYARLDVFGRDLRGGIPTDRSSKPAVRGWIDLCSLWRGGEEGDGLWGLRLSIKGRAVGPPAVVTLTNDDSEEQSGAIEPETGDEDSAVFMGRPDNSITQPSAFNILNVEDEWVVSGLSQIKTLHWLELAIEDENVERTLKIQFCANLAAKLSTPESKVDVWYVENMDVHDEKFLERRDFVVATGWGPEPESGYMYGMNC